MSTSADASHRKRFEVALRDRMVPGFSIGYSEIGFQALCIECFCLRLISTNVSDRGRP
jgi:hypothetical protein